MCVIKSSPEVNTDFECPHPKLEFCHKSKQFLFSTQRRWRQFLYFCMIIEARLISVDLIWHFMHHIVVRKTENYKKLFIIKFHQNLRKSSSLDMVRFFLRSVYNKAWPKKSGKVHFTVLLFLSALLKNIWPLTEDCHLQIVGSNSEKALTDL